MDRMSYTDWQKLPSGWDWRREPDSLRVIGLKGTSKTDNLSLTPRESSRAQELYQGSLVSTKTTSVSLGSTKTTSVSLGSTKTTLGSTKTTLGSTGSVNTTFGSTGSDNRTLGLARCTSGCLRVDGTIQTTSGLDGTLKTTLGSLERLQETSRTLQTAGGLLGRVKPTSEALGTTKGTVSRFESTATTFGTTPRMDRTCHLTTALLGRMSGTSRVTQRTNKAAHTPIIEHIIMVCGFKDDSVMVECINKKQWTTLNDVISIGINEPNTFHTVKSDGATFKARPLEVDIRMLKGFLTFFKRTADTEGRLLDEDDVMNTFTTTDFKHYCRTMDYHTDMVAAGSVSIPSFGTLIADGVFHVASALRPSLVVPTALPLDTKDNQEGAVSKMARAGVLHVESAPPSLLVSAEGSKDKDVALDVEVNNGSSNNCLFAESWLIDGALNDMEEYELVFEEEGMTAGSLSCSLIADCSNIEEEPLVLQRDTSISKWGAKYEVMHDGFNVLQGGTIKHEALNVIENGEQMFVGYNQRMLIAVLDSARVFDPGGQYNKMEKVNQNIPVQQ
jgi:hypothetical protein